MIKKHIAHLATVFLFASLAYKPAFAANEPETALIQPALTILDNSLSDAQIKEQSLAARRYYTFWHTGNAQFAKQALADKFIDLNLPQGRPQGPAGPLQASKQFREAVPDLTLEVKEMMIVGNKIIGRLHFTGHYTGTFKGAKGKGQPIDFSAVDIYSVENGKIIENWHLEDNLTLLKQLEMVSLEK